MLCEVTSYAVVRRTVVNRETVRCDQVRYQVVWCAVGRYDLNEGCYSAVCRSET